MARHNSEWRHDVQREENATSSHHLLNHDSCFAHVDFFRQMKRTSFGPGWRRQSVDQKVYTRTRIICLFRCWKILPLSLFFFFFFFFFLTTLVCHHSGRQRQTEADNRSVTSRNQLIARQRNDFQPRQLRCSFAARLSASQSSEVHSDEELIQDTTALKRQDERHTTPVTSSQSSTSSTCTCTKLGLVTFCSRPHIPRVAAHKQATRSTSVSQILADNFENVLVRYASIFTGPQTQMPSSPYQHGLSLVRSWRKGMFAQTRYNNAPVSMLH